MKKTVWMMLLSVCFFFLLVPFSTAGSSAIAKKPPLSDALIGYLLLDEALGKNSRVPNDKVWV